ncbi:hypothetical protein SISNIDRAFT_458653 [Sistotremastrum niveocremeum HHB9708]|uniref:Uncharacterized protein n=1 Tax=Sistotremastrum niveocremeum HHB9708 TaxID=1314777 RepID=A0A164Q9U3_9AGAM|nr:hypothetical protein SISNIDRAFT_458653 [Sistotremastrum niveocremeum HHB9708]
MGLICYWRDTRTSFLKRFSTLSYLDSKTLWMEKYLKRELDSNPSWAGLAFLSSFLTPLITTHNVIGMPLLFSRRSSTRIITLLHHLPVLYTLFLFISVASEKSCTLTDVRTALPLLASTSTNVAIRDASTFRPFVRRTSHVNEASTMLVSALDQRLPYLPSASSFSPTLAHPLTSHASSPLKLFQSANRSESWPSHSTCNYHTKCIWLASASLLLCLLDQDILDRPVRFQCLRAPTANI